MPTHICPYFTTQLSPRRRAAGCRGGCPHHRGCDALFSGNLFLGNKEQPNQTISKTMTNTCIRKHNIHNNDININDIIMNIMNTLSLHLQCIGLLSPLLVQIRTWHNEMIFHVLFHPFGNQLRFLFLFHNS